MKWKIGALQRTTIRFVINGQINYRMIQKSTVEKLLTDRTLDFSFMSTVFPAISVGDAFLIAIILIPTVGANL